MDDNFVEEQDLTFTKEDRMETIQKIRDKHHIRENKRSHFLRIGKHNIGPVLGIVTVLVLVVGLLLQNFPSNANTGKKNLVVQRASHQEDTSFSAILIGEDASNPSNQRSTITILLTYNGSEKSLKLVPIPRDTYVEIVSPDGKSLRKDKLMNAAVNSTPMSTLKTVSNLFDIPIDYYAMIPEEKIYAELGFNREMVKEDRKQIAELIKGRLSLSNVTKLLEESKTNITQETINKIQSEDLNMESVQVIDLEDGLEDTFIDGIYYVKISEKKLNSTSEILKQHLQGK